LHNVGKSKVTRDVKDGWLSSRWKSFHEVCPVFEQNSSNVDLLAGDSFNSVRLYAAPLLSSWRLYTLVLIFNTLIILMIWFDTELVVL
jgi:hypothetical protein